MKKILLIDDETHVRDSIARVLSREGYDVETAANAEAGLTMLADAKYDVLISDIIMPGIDGVEAIRRARDAQPDIKIVAISGGGNFGHKAYEPNAITTTAYLQSAAEAGADWVITKPFERRTLVESVRRLFEDE
ncbi:MAG: response regulator [Woeseiaceae bacterium]